MKQPGRFLTAEWINILMLNYAVDPSLLQSFIPSGTELDAFEGRTYMSLVGFEFNRTRMLGIAAPFHGSFEEVNLRFYVRRSSRRGVVFIRELVPRFAVAAIARSVFGENYSSVPMSHRVRQDPEGAPDSAIEAEYSWGSGAHLCTMRIRTEGQGFIPAEGSLSQFITEHYWGYTARPGGKSFEYEVQHPKWLVREGKSSEFSGDSAPFYGAALARVLQRPPDSAFLAEGSPVTVFKGSRIT
jgi:hypothetical protein